VNLTIGDVAETIRGVTYEKAEARSSPHEGYSPLIRATNIENGVLVLDSFVHVPDAVISDDQRLRVGDIVLAASSGSLSVVGKAALVRHPWTGTFGAFCYVVRPQPDRVVPDYLAYFMQTSLYRNRVSALAAGVNINNLRREHIENIELPYCTLAEQRRIVAAVDSYVTRIDDAVASLQRVQAKLKAYRASVLKAAVEGRLVPTEASLARAESRDYEPAEVLVARILRERRRRWEEAELAKFKAARKTPKDNRWQTKYQEPAVPDSSKLPELPSGWCWVNIDQLGLVSGGLTQNAKRETHATKLPFLRVANVYANALVLDEIKMIGVEPGEIARARLSVDDLLVVEGNGSVDQIGRVALWDGSIEPILHQNHLIKVRCEPRQLSKWLLAWLLSPAGRAAIEQVASSTSGLHTLSISKVGRLLVPLPPLSEQARACDEVDSKGSLVDGVLESVSRDLRRCARLRQAVLKWAFEGKLVDQDPTDEPADMLLARIRAERVAAAPVKKTPSPRARGAR
jgi:type I restriction enzyme S subunit